MAIIIPETAAEIDIRSKADVQRELVTSNPFLKNSWLGALITSMSNRIFDFYLQLKEAIRQNFPDTAIGDFLIRWAAIWGKQRTPATQAIGNVVATGVDQVVVPIGTVLTGSEGNYITTGTILITEQVINVFEIKLTGQTAKVTTASSHTLANNVLVSISEAIQSEYNVSAVITVTGLNTFEYQVVGSPDSPATTVTTITATFTSASIPIISDDFGANINLAAGEEVTLQSPIVDVDDILTVDFGEVGGGTDQETDSSLRIRLLDRIQDPVAHFNVSDIIDKAKEVAGVTRVFVQEAGFEIGTAAVSGIERINNIPIIATATLASSSNFQSGQTVTITGAIEDDYNVTNEIILVESDTIFHYIVRNEPDAPATTATSFTATVTLSIGRVRVFFMRDNDINPIPSGSEIATVRTEIEKILPATTASIDLFVLAPIAVTTDFTFNSLTPNTSTMQAAIIANLKVFYADSTSVGINIDKDAYRAAIFNTVDTETGDVVLTFNLTEPTVDIEIASDEIGTLGNTVFL